MAASPTMRLRDEVVELAVGQYGAIARFQLLQSMRAGEVDGLVRRGRLVVIERGVYRVRGSGIVPEQAAMAAVLRTRNARVSGPFVLGLYGAEGFSRDDPFIVLARPGRWPRNVAFPVSADPCRGQHDATWGAGLPTVTPTLCLVDAAHPRRRLSDRQIRVAVDSLRWSGQTTTARLRGLAADLPDHLGARRLARMFDNLDLISESERERLLGTVTDSINPAPERQAWIGGCRPDFLWRLLMLALEYDGEVHDQPDRHRQDTGRDRRLAEAGCEVVHVRAADLADLPALRARLVAILRRRAQELGLDITVE